MARDLLNNRHYRRLFAARTISNLGNGIAPIALAFGVLGLPGSTPTSLSIVLAAQAIPLVVMLPIGGVVADRFGRARVVGITDIAMSVVVMGMAVAFLTGHATIPLLAVLSFVAGLLNGLWWPAFPGLVPDVVSQEEHLQPANAYISVGSNAGLILGNAIGGLLVAVLGAGLAIAIDAVSFLVAGVLVFSFRRASTPHQSGESMIGDLADGWRSFIALRWVVVTVAAASVFVMAERGAQEVMGPVLAKESYGGAIGWAIVLGGMSVGLLVGALLATRIRVQRPVVVALAVVFTLPAWFVMLAFTLPLPAIVVGAFFTGMAYEVMGVLWFTALQTHVPRESLSRVSSYDTMGSLILGPIGLALAGPLIAAVGLQESFLVAAGLTTTALVAALAFPSVRGLRSTTGASDSAPITP